MAKIFKEAESRRQKKNYKEIKNKIMNNISSSLEESLSEISEQRSKSEASSGICRDENNISIKIRASHSKLEEIKESDW